MRVWGLGGGRAVRSDVGSSEQPQEAYPSHSPAPPRHPAARAHHEGPVVQPPHVRAVPDRAQRLWGGGGGVAGARGEPAATSKRSTPGTPSGAGARLQAPLTACMP